MPSLISRVRLLAICMQICVLVPACLAVGSPSFARSNFDGDWSVFIETRGGACPASVRYPVAITNGIVSNAGDVPAADHGKSQATHCLVRDEIIEVKGRGNLEGAFIDLGGQGRRGDFEPALIVIVIDGNTIADLETRWILKSDLPLVAIAVGGQ